MSVHPPCVTLVPTPQAKKARTFWAQVLVEKYFPDDQKVRHFTFVSIIHFMLVCGTFKKTKS